MYLLKPYLTCVGMLLVVASYFMMFHPTEAVLKYLQVVSSTKEEAASWSKAFLVESTRSSMWQSPIFPMIIHLVQAGGCLVGCLGAVFVFSISFGSSNRFTEGACLLLALIAYIPLTGDNMHGFTSLNIGLFVSIGVLMLGLVVNRLVKSSSQGEKAKGN